MYQTHRRQLGLGLLAYPFLFQGAEEGFRYRVIPAIASTTHAWEQFIGITKSFPVIATVLTALI